MMLIKTNNLLQKKCLEMGMWSKPNYFCLHIAIRQMAMFTRLVQSGSLVTAEIGINIIACFAAFFDNVLVLRILGKSHET